MRRLHLFVFIALTSAAFFMLPTTAGAEDISDTIVRTLILSENTRLAGDGADMWNQSSPANNNSFLGNLCLTAVNAPCPAFPSDVIPTKPAR